MEWVETTGKSLDEAKEIALDRLGIGPDDAEFEILEEPRTGLFGRVRGAARVRARVKPATVRPKQDRRNRRRAEGKGRGGEGSSSADTNGDRESTAESGASGRSGSADAPSGPRRRSSRRRGGGQGSGDGATTRTAPDHASSTDNTPAGGTETEDTMSDASSTHESAPVDVASVQTAAEEFTNGLLRSFGLTGTATSTVEGNEIEVRVDGQGDGLGLLIGPGGRTLLAVQDLARVAAQRRLGDHDTRLRVDVAGYREKRRVALEKFASHVADLVKESGVARSLDPMPSADRKIVHDTLSGIEGVTTRSEGEDPYRRIIVSPA
jgi:spoIIIJ-associated protein